ncbi:MAG: aminoacyl-histidine dipeptidase, partial [Clostridiales bacterium]|nr:aminoacyl-histidine dipeptidase [Clostridiales bacterium]
MQASNTIKWFRRIAQIPRVSGNERAISDWLVQTARGMGLEARQDEALNVVIRKGQGTPITLQGHMDMVGEKEAGSGHDFARDPIQLVEKGDMLYADGTTLGADNGMAVAMMLSLMEEQDDTLPPLEALITTGEEVGLIGANRLTSDMLRGRALINLDAEEEGVFLTSCAGGETVHARFTPHREGTACPTLRIALGGFRGGHSGLEIDKGRLNAIKELAALLRQNGAQLVSLTAPGKFNAISRQAEAVVAVQDEGTLIDRAEQALAAWRKQEPEAVLNIAAADPAQPMTRPASDALLALLAAWPNGVHTMSEDLPGLVESSANLGLIEQQGDTLTITASIRSSAPARMQELEDAMRALCDRAGGTIEITGKYPGWAYEKESALRDTAVRVWQ